MTFLQLVQRLHSEAGLGGSAPAAVTGQTGMNLKLVNWILSAYESIWTMYPNWKFRQTEFSFGTTAAKQNYTPAEASITDLSTWKTDDVKIYLVAADETHLTYMPWDAYKDIYVYGSFRTQTTRPVVFTIKPDDSMDFWPIPDAHYTPNGEYFKVFPSMTANGDQPAFDDEYHMVIVWYALKFFAGRQGANVAYVHGENEYRQIMRRMKRKYLPKFTWGAPLA